MGTKPPRPGVLATAVLFALSCVGLILFVWISLGGTVPLQPQGYRFHASFAQAALLTRNAEVRISGVRVGKVAALRPTGYRTDATIELNPEFAPIRRDAHAILRTKTLLGETFVEITPGTPTAPRLADGGRLPTSQVQDTQGLDQALGTFDAPTRQALKDFLRQLAVALKDRSVDLNDALGNADPTVTNLTTLVTLLDRQGPALQGLVRDGGATLRAIARRGADVQGIVVAGDQVLSATAARNHALTATVNGLPAFLRDLRSSLGQVDATARDAAPSIAALRPVAPLVRPALVETLTLAPALGSTLRQLGPIITAARPGLPALTQVLDVARPLIRQLQPVAHDLVPLASLLNLYKRELLGDAANVGAMTQATAIVGGQRQHYQRVVFPANNEDFYGQARRPGSNRHNPYFAPGAYSSFATGLPAFDCANAGNPSPIPPFGPVLPCRTAAPWAFGGSLRQFPHLVPAAP